MFNYSKLEQILQNEAGQSGGGSHFERYLKEPLSLALMWNVKTFQIVL